MSLPVAAIVGRPNVGKSSLLNCLTGKRIAIVDATPGVTRDRISAPLALNESGESGRYVELVDTGGIGIEDVDNLTEHVESQIAYAIGAAALIIFLVDARQGATPLDRQVARRLRRQERPVILVANKVDRPNLAAEVGELHSLGFGEPVCISATHALGTDDLLEAVRERLGEAARDEPVEPIMKLAVVGKRNAGKSTFINALAGQPRVIVSETPGTTRDSIDVQVELAGRPFVLIDTAGVRKKRKLADDVEYYSRHRALRSIRRADVVALMLDASVPVSQVDKELAGEIAEQFKPVLFLVNKWDLAREVADGEDYAEYLTKMFPSLAYAPISLASATEGTNLPQTIRLAEQLFTQSRRRVPTSQLNVAIGEILKLRGPSHKAGTRPPKILYASQVSTAPPTIVFFVNDVRSFDTGYQRFLLNQMRERLDFAEVPVRLIFRQRRQK
ncbi:MAG: ribosome biogenesis GTPase Der [Planctomycetota bacterium]|nr:ribosome biogenesis GTPase Der [Planctomycetota bacterium]